MSTIFTFGEQEFRCSIPSFENDTYTSQGRWHDILKNETIPMLDKDGQDIYSSCKIYQPFINGTTSKDNSSKQQEKCSTWVYDQSVFRSTVASEMDLVCDDLIYQSHAAMIFFAGLLCGSIIMGALADVCGRKPVLFLCVSVLLAANIATIWVPNYIGFVILRFLIGVVNIGIFDAGIVIGLELVGPSKRVYTGILIQHIWCIGEVYLLLAAFILRDWRHFQISLCIPIGMVVLYCWAVPESPRWLITKGKKSRAMNILNKAAKVNGVELPKNIEIFEEQESTSFLQILPLLKSPRLLGRLAITSLNWFVIAMGYFGLTLNTGKLGGDVYINFLVTIVVEFIGYTCCLFLMDRVGRRPLLCAFMLVGGTACICTLFTSLYADKSLHWITIALSNVGKCGVSGAFAMVFLFTPELFPTTNRSFILGVSNMAGRLGGMASPYMANLGQLVESQFGKALPVMIFGSVMLLSGISSLLLPETKDNSLPENIAEAIELGVKKSSSNRQIIDGPSVNTRV